MLSCLQLSLIFMCASFLSRWLEGSSRIPLLPMVIVVFSLLHILPVLSYSLISNPIYQFFTGLLLFCAILGLNRIQKKDIQDIMGYIIESRWSLISLILVIAIRISTLPEDQSLVRGDIVSHIVPIFEWTDGKLGYPGVTYPRGFHGFFLTLSFGFEYSLVSHSVFITLQFVGWLFFLKFIMFVN